MSDHSPEVIEKISKTISAAENAVNFVPPNEHVAEGELDKLRTEAQEIKSLLLTSTRIDLIERVSSSLRGLEFHSIEHDTASRGSLVIRIQALELTNRLQSLRDTARESGYFDQSLMNFNPRDEVPAKYIQEIDKRLQEVKDLTLNLEKQLVESKKASLRLSIGPVSMPVNALVQIIKQNTSDAIEYIAIQTNVNASALKNKLQSVTDSSSDLLNAMKSESKSFGSKLIEVSTKMAKAAAQSLASGLRLIKKIFVKDVDQSDIPLAQVTDLGSEGKFIYEFVFPMFNDEQRQLANLIRDGITALRDVDALHENYITNGSVINCKLTNRDGYYGISITIRIAKDLLHVERDKPRVFDFTISSSDFIRFSKLSKIQIQEAGRYGFNQMKAANQGV